MAKTPPSRTVTPKAQPMAPQPKRAKQVKVIATRQTYYGEKRRREGDVFLISGEKNPPGHARAGDLKELSKAMRVVESDTPLKESTPNGEIARKHDEILGKRVAGDDTGGEQLGAGEDEDEGHGNPLDA